MALKWRGYPGSNPVRLALLASRDKINRTPGDVCYDLLWYSCHSHIALPDKIMITLGTLDPFSNSHDSVRPRPCKNDETFCSGSTYSESFYTQCYQPTISDHLLVHISRVLYKDRFIKKLFIPLGRGLSRNVCFRDFLQP